MTLANASTITDATSKVASASTCSSFSRKPRVVDVVAMGGLCTFDSLVFGRAGHRAFGTQLARDACQPAGARVSDDDRGRRPDDGRRVRLPRALSLRGRADDVPSTSVDRSAKSLRRTFRRCGDTHSSRCGRETSSRVGCCFGAVAARISRAAVAALLSDASGDALSTMGVSSPLRGHSVARSPRSRRLRTGRLPFALRRRRRLCSQRRAWWKSRLS
mmetsp:Transcript_11102/g.33260  ORF Transcript_11102/g.33260 Transcript_11102/m.33260 type:complete len:217 (+) Transcript_11102:1095-1745(+)